MTNAQRRQFFRDNPEIRRVYNRRYYAKNVLLCRAACKSWRTRNQEAAREVKRRFRADNPNHDREYRDRRKLRRALHKFASICAGNRVVSHV